MWSTGQCSINSTIYPVSQDYSYSNVMYNHNTKVVLQCLPDAKSTQDYSLISIHRVLYQNVLNVS